MRRSIHGVVLTMLFSSQVPARADERLSAYDSAVLADHPVLYLAVSGQTGSETDLSDHGHVGTYDPARPTHQVTLPNGDKAASFDGATESLDIPSAPDLSIPTTGILTVEAWLRPEGLQFHHSEGEGFVYWLGKGSAGQQEYAGRMYSRQNTANPPRPNRVSGYVFNLDGGLGSGAYFQDPLHAGDWLHVTLVFKAAPSTGYPAGYARIYKGGVVRQTVSLSQFDVVPGVGEAPLRIGTRDGNSFFEGAVAKIAVYDYELPAPRIAAHDRLMTGP